MTHPDDPTSEHVREVDDIAEGPDPDVESGPEETEEDAAEARRLLAEAETGAQGDWNLHDADTDDAQFLTDEDGGT